MSFSDLGLLPELLRAVVDKGYDTPSPIHGMLSAPRRLPGTTKEQPKRLC